MLSTGTEASSLCVRGCGTRVILAVLQPRAEEKKQRTGESKAVLSIELEPLELHPTGLNHSCSASNDDYDPLGHMTGRGA